MPFDNQVASMTPGQALLDVPVPTLIETTAKAIAAAQFELDASAVRAAVLLSETRIDFRDEDGETVRRSLLELGFTPSFYHFSETEMDFRVTLTVKVESGIDLGVGGAVQGGNQPLAFAASVSLEVHHKFGFEMSATTKIRTLMKAVPPPQQFIGAIQTHAATGGTFTVPTDDDEEPGPEPEPQPEPEPEPEPGPE
jgi:hypothetical protein